MLCHSSLLIKTILASAVKQERIFDLPVLPFPISRWEFVARIVSDDADVAGGGRQCGFK